jgi:hypothetical protein
LFHFRDLHSKIVRKADAVAALPSAADVMVRPSAVPLSLLFSAWTTLRPLPSQHEIGPLSEHAASRWKLLSSVRAAKDLSLKER